MPLLSLFAPLPLALMIPFMAAQSFAMGEAFGKGFQSGKRRVSSMTNAKFNATSQIQMFQETTADINGMIPAMKAQMSNFTLLQSDIIKELVSYVRKLPADVFAGLTGDTTSSDPNTDFLHALGIGASGALSPNVSPATAIQGAALGASAPSPSPPILADWLKLLQAQQSSTMKSSESSANAKLLKDLQAQLLTIQAQQGKTTTSANPNVSKVVVKGNIKTTYNNKGQIISQNVIDPSKIPASKTGRSTSAQTIVKATVVKKLRAPSSLVLQKRKLLEAIRVGKNKYQSLTSRSGLNSRIRQQYYNSYITSPRASFDAFMNRYRKYDL